MRVAALYDVNGNVRALEAVLEEVESANVEAIVFGGDLVWGAWPRETLELAQPLGAGAQFLSGNMDRIALANREDESTRFVQERLTEEQQRFVTSWPSTLSIDGVLYCHATPHSDEDVVTPASSEAVRHDVLRGVYDVEAAVASMRRSGFPRPHFADGLEAPLSYERVLEWWAP